MRSWLKARPHLIPCAVAAALALVAVADLPYGYYVMLRWVVCSAAVFVVVVAVITKLYWAAWVYGVIALLFNPVAPIHLTKGLWRPVDIVSGLAFILAAVVVRYGGSHQKGEAA